MKRRLAYLLVLATMVLATVAGSVWHPSSVYASGEDYVFYNSNGSNKVYARDGVYGNGLTTYTSTGVQDPNIPAGLQGTYNTIVTAPSANFNDGTYVATYTCNTTTVYALIGLTKGLGNSDTAALYILGSSGGALTGNTTHTGSWLASNAPNCIPASANTKGYTSSPKTLSMPLYSGLSTSDGNDWYKFLTAHGQNVDNPGASKLSTGANVGNDNVGADTPQCETSSFAFSWFFCQIIDGLSGATADLYNDFIQPFLETKPINVSNPQSDPSQTYNIWKNFRLYGDIFLVIALLVIVFGESIGGGLIDSYTAKKVLPRLLVAAVLINISIYLVALAVDLTNILGNGIGQLIEQPFKDAGTFQLKVGGGTASFGLGIVTAGSLWAVASGGALLEFLLVFFLIPAFLALLAVLVTVIIRTGLIVFLVLISPVAFALYCLPNTEQYFRRWWDLLFRTLLIYPIIAILFALANVLSITITSASSGGLQAPIAQLIGVIALFVPLFLIPYSFRIAGGVLGRVHEVATSARQRGQEAIKGNANDPNSWRNVARNKLSNRVLSQREAAVNKGISMQKNNRSVLGKAMGGSMAGVAGLGNYQLKRSLANKNASDRVQAQVATGDDSSVRAMFARKMKYRDEAGKEQAGYFGTDAKQDADGFVIGANAPKFSEFEVGKARSTAAHDASFYQAAYTYELGKAGDDSELDNMRAANAENIQSSPWLRSQSVGIVKGSGFANAQTRRELKHESLDVDTGEYTRSSAPSTREIAENVSNWSLGNMRTSTLVAEQDDYKAARAYLALQPDSDASQEAIAQAHQDMQELATRKVKPKINNADEARSIMQHVQSTANSLDARRQQGESFRMAGEGDSQQPVSGSQTGAPGHVSEEIERLVDLAATSRQNRPRPAPR